jgi:hypothetical protein
LEDSKEGEVFRKKCRSRDGCKALRGKPHEHWELRETPQEMALVFFHVGKEDLGCPQSPRPSGRKLREAYRPFLECVEGEETSNDGTFLEGKVARPRKDSEVDAQV